MVVQRLSAEVAALYEQTTHSTRFFVQRLGREVDLTRLTLAEAAELVALPGGFEWLKRKEPAPELAVDTTLPAAPQKRRTVKKSKGAGGM